MHVNELRALLAAAGALSEVLVFVRRPGSVEPLRANVSEVVDLSTEDALVLYIDLAD